MAGVGDVSSVPARRELIRRCLDGSASEAEESALGELVASHPEVARELVSAAELESGLDVLSRAGALATLAGEPALALDAAVRRAFPAPRPLFAQRAWLMMVAAALAISSICAALVLHRLKVGPPPAAAPPASASASDVSRPEPSPPGDPASDPAPAFAAPDSPNAHAEPELAAPPSLDPRLSHKSPPRRQASNANAATDALQLANQLRRQARWADAARAYTEIAHDYAGTTQGTVAALAAASLELEHQKNPRAALALYQSAANSPALGAEAQLGIADCYHALGDRDAEIAALSRLVANYPNALVRDRAFRRLQRCNLSRSRFACCPSRS